MTEIKNLKTSENIVLYKVELWKDGNRMRTAYFLDSAEAYTLAHEVAGLYKAEMFTYEMSGRHILDLIEMGLRAMGGK